MRFNRDLLPVRREQEGGFLPWSERSLLTPSTFFSGSPWQIMQRMQEDMDRLISQFAQPALQELRQVQQSWMPSVDISQSDQEWLIEADLPGVNKDNIDVEVRNGQLLLRAELRQEQEERPQGQAVQGDAEKGAGGHAQGEQRQYYRRERRYGYFERVLPLPENVDEEQIRCEFKDGVLKVHLPKTAEAKPQARRIPIQELQSGNGQSAKLAAHETGASEEQAGTAKKKSGSAEKKAA